MDNAYRDKAYNYGVSQDAINNSLSQAKFDYQKQQDTESKKTDEKEYDSNVVSSAVADALSSGNPKNWLVSNAKYMSEAEYNAVISALKGYSAIDDVEK